MITLKLHIKNDIDISTLMYQYSGSVRYAYKNNIKAVDIIREHFNLDSQISRDALNEADSIRLKMTASKEKNKKLLEQAQKDFKETKDKKLKFKLFKKISRLQKALKKDYVFGLKSRLVQYNKALINTEQPVSKKKIRKLRKEYQSSRILPFYSSGDKAYKHGNRKFTLDIKNDKIYFTPFRGKTKYTIEINPNRKWREYLLKLQAKEGIPVTYRLTNNFICITFDLEKLNGYHFKKEDWSNALRKYPKSEETKDIRKELTKKFYKEQESRKLVGKLSNRYMAVDLNPQHIGWSILDSKLRKIAVGNFNLSSLSYKLKLSSTDRKQVYQNNKRKGELCLVWKEIFKLATHYKVAHFVVEELNFKEDAVNTKATEANRKTRNIWHRTLTTELINKYCKELGIDLVEINPVYSSFIGNIKYKYSDPTNASLEICRRGIFKFKRGKFYPILSRRDRQAMAALLRYKVGDLIYKTVLELDTWKQAFTLFKQAGTRYRRSRETIESRFQSYKSLVTEYRFCYDL